jgi:hypothetical protein
VARGDEKACCYQADTISHAQSAGTGEWARWRLPPRAGTDRFRGKFRGTLRLTRK